MRPSVLFMVTRVLCSLCWFSWPAVRGFIRSVGMCVLVPVRLLGTCAEPHYQPDPGTWIRGSLTSAALLDLAAPNADCEGQ